jgi:hypothetical protein
MLKAGSIILTVCGAFNFALAAAILTALIAFDKKAPILFIVFEERELSALDAKVLATVKSLAILFNSCAAALSLMTILVVWCALVKGQHWAFWAIFLSAGLAQAMGFFADAAIGTKTLVPNLVLTALLLAGIGLAGFSLLKS